MKKEGFWYREIPSNHKVALFHRERYNIARWSRFRGKQQQEEEDRVDVSNVSGGFGRTMNISWSARMMDSPTSWRYYCRCVRSDLILTSVIRAHSSIYVRSYVQTVKSVRVIAAASFRGIRYLVGDTHARHIFEKLIAIDERAKQISSFIHHIDSTASPCLPAPTLRLLVHYPSFCS